MVRMTMRDTMKMNMKMHMRSGSGNEVDGGEVGVTGG